MAAVTHVYVQPADQSALQAARVNEVMRIVGYQVSLSRSRGAALKGQGLQRLRPSHGGRRQGCHVDSRGARACSLLLAHATPARITSLSCPVLPKHAPTNQPDNQPASQPAWANRYVPRCLSRIPQGGLKYSLLTGLAPSNATVDTPADGGSNSTSTSNSNSPSGETCAAQMALGSGGAGSAAAVAASSILDLAPEDQDALVVVRSRLRSDFLHLEEVHAEWCIIMYNASRAATAGHLGFNPAQQRIL